MLRRTVEMNGLSNVVPVPYALGAERGEAEMLVSGSASTQFRIKAFEYQDKETVGTITLDEYVQKHGLRVGLIKADIEGAEHLMLKGAINTIKEQKPALHRSCTLGGRQLVVFGKRCDLLQHHRGGLQRRHRLVVCAKQPGDI